MTARKDTVLAAKAANTRGKCGVVVTKAVKARGKGSVLVAKAVDTRGIGSILATKAILLQGVETAISTLWIPTRRQMLHGAPRRAGVLQRRCRTGSACPAGLAGVQAALTGAGVEAGLQLGPRLRGVAASLIGVMTGVGEPAETPEETPDQASALPNRLKAPNRRCCGDDWSVFVCAHRPAALPSFCRAGCRPRRPAVACPTAARPAGRMPTAGTLSKERMPHTHNNSHTAVTICRLNISSLLKLLS